MLAVQERNGWLEETVSFHNCAEFLFPISSKWNSWLVCGLQQVHKHVHFLKNFTGWNKRFDDRQNGVRLAYMYEVANQQDEEPMQQEDILTLACSLVIVNIIQNKSSYTLQLWQFSIRMLFVI